MSGDVWDHSEIDFPINQFWLGYATHWHRIIDTHGWNEIACCAVRDEGQTCKEDSDNLLEDKLIWHCYLFSLYFMSLNEEIGLSSLLTPQIFKLEIR